VAHDVDQIGQVAEGAGPSLRTIHHYDDIGLAKPSGRTAGGFRLYTDVDIDRLKLTKHVKPLEFASEETHDLLDVRDRLGGASSCENLRELLAQFAIFASTVDESCEVLREHLQADESTVRMLQRQAARHRCSAATPR
jgi:DNA-binding transcriptional MerR regulator